MARFGDWRGSRPFLAGLLALLAAAEIALIPLSSFKFVLMQGIGGVGSLVCAGMLAAAGVGLWLRPGRARLLGLAIIATGFVSYLAANLGGLLLGMALALVSGSLAVAWRTVAA
jgi:Family of unknown function (DUF6114)